MITEKEIEIAQSLLATGVVKSVYHSVELIEDKDGQKFPAYKKGGEQFYIGPDDMKDRYAYIRQTGPARNIKDELQGSCSGMTDILIPMRIVVFKDHEKDNHDSLVQRLLKFTFLKGVSLLSFSTNAFQLSRQESPLGDFFFDATTFYLAIDFNVKLLITAKMCDEPICKDHLNPICP